MPMKSVSGARRPLSRYLSPCCPWRRSMIMVIYPSVLSPPCSCTEIGQRPTAEFAKQMLPMPAVVSSLPPLAADAFYMAKTDDNFHLKCPTELPRGDYPPLTLATRRPPRPFRLFYVPSPLVASRPGPQKHSAFFSSRSAAQLSTN
jgi:hypothetical protein